MDSTDSTRNEAVIISPLTSMIDPRMVSTALLRPVVVNSDLPGAVSCWGNVWIFFVWIL